MIKVVPPPDDQHYQAPRGGLAPEPHRGHRRSTGTQPTFTDRKLLIRSSSARRLQPSTKGGAGGDLPPSSPYLPPSSPYLPLPPILSPGARLGSPHTSLDGDQHQLGTYRSRSHHRSHHRSGDHLEIKKSRSGDHLEIKKSRSGDHLEVRKSRSGDHLEIGSHHHRESRSHHRSHHRSGDHLEIRSHHHRRSRSHHRRSRSHRRTLFRENSRSAESGGFRKRGGFRSRYRNEQGPDDEDYVSPITRFRKVARLVQLALIFYSGEGKTRARGNEDKDDSHAFFEKPDKMTFLPAFDPSLFKAQRIKELVVGSDIKDILGKRPEDRSEEEIQQVMFALRTYETFAEYPLNMQERMCRKAHYLRFDANRIILRQGDRAEWFYYVLSGTTAVSILEENKTTGSVNLRNVGYLTRGTAFGELALLHGSRRTATVSCKDAVELIAVDKEDFVQMNQLDSDEEKEHIRYCRTLAILHDWPVNLLNEVTGICNFHFFKKGTVMAKSNHNTPFIYIVKSGHVRVLTKVTKVRQRIPQGCRVRSRTASSRVQGARSCRSDTSEQSSQLGYRSRVNSQSTSNGGIPTHGSSRHMRGNLVPLISRLNVGEGLYQDVPIQPTFLQVCVLGTGDSFGLSSVVYTEEISCGIVSLGAECIEISKEFFLKHASENYLRNLKATIRPFPSEDKLQQDIQDQKLWNNYKNTVVASVLDPSSI